MAKMFYSLEEAAEKLGVNADEVKSMASSGKLQQFRDRDKLMFKREQVDSLSQNKDSLGAGLEEVIGLAQNAANSNTGTSTDAININEQTGTNKSEDPRQKTGVSVFDADEVEEADPMAQTQMTNTIEESDTDLMIESVGSGSGLLDLTRESDDTSLGAELLDEIYPTGGGESPEIGSGNENRSQEEEGSGGVFDSAIAAEPSTSGLDNLAENTGTMETPGIVTVGAVEEIYDPVYSGFASGALAGATITLGIGFIIAVGTISGVASVPQVFMAANASNLGMALGGMLIGSFIFAGAGFGIAKMRG